MKWRANERRAKRAWLCQVQPTLLRSTTARMAWSLMFSESQPSCITSDCGIQCETESYDSRGYNGKACRHKYQCRRLWAYFFGGRVRYLLWWNKEQELVVKILWWYSFLWSWGWTISSGTEVYSIWCTLQVGICKIMERPKFLLYLLIVFPIKTSISTKLSWHFMSYLLSQFKHIKH